MKERPDVSRPRIEINQTEFEKLCGLQCPLDEIASWFFASEDTIERWCKRTYGKRFAEVYAEKRGRGKIALRRSQFELAKRNASMAIWLGKQYLGQTDNPEIADPEALRRAREILEGVESAIE